MIFSGSASADGSSNLSPRHVICSKNGYYGKIALTAKDLAHWPDCPAGVKKDGCPAHFMVTPDTNYWMLSGMFKHHVVGPAINATLNHLKHYNMRWGSPAAPEGYSSIFEPHGDQYA